jgi:hypothetical protein
MKNRIREIVMVNSKMLDIKPVKEFAMRVVQAFRQWTAAIKDE